MCRPVRQGVRRKGELHTLSAKPLDPTDESQKHHKRSRSDEGWTERLLPVKLPEFIACH